VAPGGGEFLACVLMTAPICQIRRINLDTPYHNRAMYHRAMAPSGPLVSELLVSEVQDSDTIALGLPLYNYGVPRQRQGLG
jgi:hypothetical protein